MHNCKNWRHDDMCLSSFSINAGMKSPPVLQLQWPKIDWIPAPDDSGCLLMQSDPCCLAHADNYVILRLRFVYTADWKINILYYTILCFKSAIVFVVSIKKFSTRVILHSMKLCRHFWNICCCISNILVKVVSLLDILLLYNLPQWLGN